MRVIGIEEGESEMWRDPKEGGWRGREWERFPCWELGLWEIGDWEDDEVDAWACEGKMDMKNLEGKGEVRRCEQPNLSLLNRQIPIIALTRLSYIFSSHSPNLLGIGESAASSPNIVLNYHLTPPSPILLDYYCCGTHYIGMDNKFNLIS